MKVSKQVKLFTWLFGAVIGWITFGAVILFVGLFMTAYQFHQESRMSASTQKSQGTTSNIPNLTLTDYHGNAVRLADFQGKPLVVNSWAAWCPFCRDELPDLAAAQKEFGDRVTFVAIDRAESLETAKSYSDTLGVTDRLVMLLDPRDSFYQAIGGFSMPETIFVNAQGETVFHKRGPMALDEIRERTKALLGP